MLILVGRKFTLFHTNIQTFINELGTYCKLILLLLNLNIYLLNC